jgi:phosphoribosylaminoimidazole synthetase/phosphoribosylamine--glycine ligase
MTNILIIGSGGREYAIALKLSLQNNDIELFYIGSSRNAGLDTLCSKKHSHIIDLSDEKSNTEICKYAKEWNVDFVVIGPEKALQNGLADALENDNILCFGPKKDAAKIETSKMFTRHVLHNSEALNGYNLNPKHRYVDSKYYSDDNSTILNNISNFINSELQGEYVIKPDGLCGGKGVKLSGIDLKITLEGLEYMNELIQQKSSFLVEEKLVGDEFSLMSFTDGKNVLHTIPVKDYKRAFENNIGPNTGSMGSVTGFNNTLHFLTDEDINLAKEINENVINELKGEFKGVLYGSFIKVNSSSSESSTNTSIKVIEFNARFGDPECINVFALMESNLLEVLLASANGTLSNVKELKFKKEASCFKYLVPTGYPTHPRKGDLVTFLPEYFEKETLIYANIANLTQEDKNRHDMRYFNARQMRGKYIELGSRTVGVIRLSQSISKAALQVNSEFDMKPIPFAGKEFENVEQNFKKQIEGHLRYRKDIGLEIYSTLGPPVSIEEGKIDSISDDASDDTSNDAYSKAGVNIDEGNRVVKEIKSAVESTFTENVYSNFGDFAGMIRIPAECKSPIFVASTDGVGTKSILVLETYGPEVGYNMLGQDLVNHCVNDTLVKGAMPHFFLDYFGANTIKAEHVKYFVEGVAKSCREVGCALLGGETAEMPDIYKEGHSEVSGTMIGIVDEKHIIDGKKNITKGDVVIGIPSSGPHTNGFTLIRKILADHEAHSDIKTPQFILESLCATHRNYLPDIKEIMERGIDIHGMCHVTGGGFSENPKRILSDGLDLELFPFEYSDVFKYLQRIGKISDKDMLKTFNCGYGMLLFVNQEDSKKIMSLDLASEYKLLGKVLSPSEKSK